MDHEWEVILTDAYPTIQSAKDIIQDMHDQLHTPDLESRSSSSTDKPSGRFWADETAWAEEEEDLEDLT